MHYYHSLSLISIHMDDHFVNRKQPSKGPTQTQHNDDQSLNNQSNNWHLNNGDPKNNLDTGNPIINLQTDEE